MREIENSNENLEIIKKDFQCDHEKCRKKFPTTGLRYKHIESCHSHQIFIKVTKKIFF